jgi:HD associated region
MIERAVYLGITENKIPWLANLYSYDGSNDYIREYLNWYDDKLVSEILDKGTIDGYAKDIFARLHNRRLFKCIFDVDQNDFPDADVRNFVFGDSKGFHKLLEDLISKQFGFDKNHVIAYRISFNSATKTESEIPVIHPSHKKTIFNDESALFRSVNQQIREERFQVYAPAKYRDEKDKSKHLRDFKTGILGLITELADPQKKLALEGGQQL